MQPNRDGSTQVFGKRLNSHRLCCCTVASVQFCFGDAGGHNPRQQERARHLDEPAIQIDTPTRGLPTKNRPTLFEFLKSCASGRYIFEHSFVVANVMSGQSWDKKFSLAATARNMVVSSSTGSESMLPSLCSTLVSPFTATPGGGAGLAPVSPKALITSFTWRGSASIQSPLFC